MYYTNLLKNRANSENLLLAKQNKETWVIKYSVALLNRFLYGRVPEVNNYI